ncbi:cask-interacting protein (caskin) 1,2 [Histomonas meleagridis]|uniref:cask-interacting protein (caskin) n=1 Tax=Histomonas meleagridis TaxID=135588 RepID=UPI00355972E9|nr:cask-interacting protein (caskin) 1,2 [Histomonas meleagridis]KAH0806685.1 cask-interacting protein (caskin) [Histomonas meleagridis]
MSTNPLLQKLIEFENVIYKLSEENLQETSENLSKFFDEKYAFSFILLVCQYVKSLVMTQRHDGSLYIKFLQELEKQIKHPIINTLSTFLVDQEKSGGESHYMLNKLVEQNLLDPNSITLEDKSIFIHYKSQSEINQFKQEMINAIREVAYNYGIPLEDYGIDPFAEINRMFADNFKYHKENLSAGETPNEIIKAIRRDNLEELQKLASAPGFDIDEVIAQNPYERYSFINNGNNTLIDYAAFFGSIKCFKYLMMNGADLSASGTFAIAGGNIEIIQLCEQNKSGFRRGLDTAIAFHRNEIFKGLYEKSKLNDNDYANMKFTCMTFTNFEIFEFLESQNPAANHLSLAQETAPYGNIWMLQYLYEKSPSSFKGILPYAVRSRNPEVIDFVLEQKDIDFNALDNRTYFQFLEYVLYYLDCFNVCMFNRIN